MWPKKKCSAPLYISIYRYIKGQRFFPLLPVNFWTAQPTWTYDTVLESAWHVDGFFWLKISIPTAMEWPGTETCPKSSRIANNSETMRQIEILRASYALQLLNLSSRTHFQRISEHYLVTRTFLSILTLEIGPAPTSAQYNSLGRDRTFGQAERVRPFRGRTW